MANQYNENGINPGAVYVNGQEELAPPNGTMSDIANGPNRSAEPSPALSVYTTSSHADNPDVGVLYEFYIPVGIVGRLIGRFGAFVSRIKSTTGASVIVKRHPNSTSHKICAIEGKPLHIEKALEMIKERFPAKKFPQFSLDQVNPPRVGPGAVSILPTNNKLLLIEGVSSDVIVSHVTNLNDIFLQHPCHPTYPSLTTMNEALASVYEEGVGIPGLPRPFNAGVICIARLAPNKWFRVQVTEVDEEKERVKVKILDVGGYQYVPMKNLRQIRIDFINVPFQATECSLANISPLDKEVGWSNEAIHHFKNLTANHVLRAFVVGYDVDNDKTLIHLFKINGNQPPVFINKELADYGLVKWWDSDTQSLTSTGVEMFQ